jgi:UPF0755 protein
MKKLAALVLILLIAAGAGAWVLYSRANAPFRSYDAPELLVSIPQGTGTAAIGARLVETGVVRDTLTFRIALWLSGDARRLQAGDYRFDAPMTARQVIDKIARGDVDVLAITFPEGLTIAEMSKIFDSSGLGDAASFVKAAGQGMLIHDIDSDATNLEGYLFPDTYNVPRKTDASALVRLMVERYRKVAGELAGVEGASQGLTARQLVTLASMVEKETSRADERPVVAAVYLNRLRTGMPMQCDPTVIYALQRAGRYDGNLRRADLTFDSLYNTYRYPGLPPGPIAAPGRASLEAAIRPAQVEYLYFVSRNDGSHEFAATLSEHNRNVNRYQVEYFRAQRAGKAGGAGRGAGKR